ncbi:DNA-binding transcriptional activator of the SARP family [Micromonospora eburnea]|uniref:DNA-binding transcriptional activator of the SARP family n=1 Tax=Micromonospora eburnea TaxID=227316 RepID=A0A1C6UUT1_9ACTN|nr:DNA-binding transcriptional activator of the SARP family [Micromonospora eburnea]
MQVRLLGPVDVTVNGRPRPVPGLRRKAVLAALALQPGQPVSVVRVIQVTWDGKPPATAVNTLQSHVSYLRRTIGLGTTIVARPPGYLLDVGAEGTDLQVASGLIRQARCSADPATAASRLRAALALWRGRPLTDVAGLTWLDEQAQWLTTLRLDAVHALVEARLALGEHAQLVPELERLTRQHPYHEDLRGQLMLALYRAGRPTDALAAYQRFRRVLGDELGTDPGPTLRRLEAAILRHDDSLDPSPVPAQVTGAGPGPAAPSRAAPAQLPLALPTFSGRVGELALLDAVLAEEAGRSPTVVITVVSGTAGVGKTALAVQWAHRVAGRFPDGQLYVNLRGFDPAGALVSPAAALRSFLDALGVPAERIPDGLADQAALYRSTLAGRRMLVLLDNARDVEQVRPLLPGTPGCLVVVTSRSELIPLVAVEGAHPVPLDLLSAPQSRELLVRRLGADRVAAEPGAVADIIARCARLPLALAVAAARAATRPCLSLAALAAELRAATPVLDALTGGDPSTDVRAVFSWSYRALSDDAARLFRLIGLHAGPDLAPPAAASLAGVPLRRAYALLAELTGMHLLAETTPGRYAFHDLLRAYALERAHGVDDRHDRDAAICRLFDHYLHTGHAAARLLDVIRAPIPLDAAPAGVTVGSITDPEAALGWYLAEYGVLLATARQAAQAGHDDHAWKLAWTLSTFLVRQGHWHDQIAVHHDALVAARRLADPLGQANAEHGLGLGYTRSGRFDEAHPHLLAALELFGGVDDRISQALVLDSLTWLAEREGRPADALAHAEHAYRLARDTGDAATQARHLNAIGWCHGLLGDHRRAVTYCTSALDLFRGLDDRNGQAATWDSLGYAYRHLGAPERAVGCYHRAIDLYRQLADPYNVALSLADLGEIHDDVGDRRAARRVWQEALSILDGLAHPDAEGIRTRLAGVGCSDATLSGAGAAGPASGRPTAPGGSAAG